MILITEVKTWLVAGIVSTFWPAMSRKMTYYEEGCIEGDTLYIRVPVCEKYSSSCDFYRYSDSEVVPAVE